MLGTGPFAVEQALKFRQWSPALTLFLHTGPEPTNDEWERLAARGIAVVDGGVTALEVTDDRLSGVRLVSGRTVAVRALAMMPRYTARGEVLTELGLSTVAHPAGVGTHLETDPSGLTAVAGVWAAGNLTALTAGVIHAAAAGVTAAIVINTDLTADDTARALERHHDPFNGPSEARITEQVLRERRHGLTTDTATPR